jgi:hypothetical protein
MILYIKEFKRRDSVNSFCDLVFLKRETLGKFCTANPDNYTEAKLNHLKLMRKYFGT